MCRDLLELQVPQEEQDHREREVVKDQLVHKDLLELEEHLVEMVVQVKMEKLVRLVIL